MCVVRICLLYLAVNLIAISAANSQAVELPERGLSTDTVSATYGAPEFTEGPVGTPPITRWIYPSFTIVFEYDKVIHTYKRDRTLETRPSSSVPKRPDPNSASADTSPADLE